MKALLAYASAHGSTAEVAQRIGKTLTAQGLDVTVAPVQTVGSVDDFDAFIFGTPIHAGTWLPEMTNFIKGFTDQLAGKPVYFFITCIRLMEQYGYDHVMEYYMIPEVLEKLNVYDKAAFAGKLDLKDVDWNERWTLAARYDGSTWPSNFDGDFREWSKIDAWAEKAAAELLAAPKT
ncbi:MAG: hypothetical protein JNJ61_22745 [Anaerolineae bacterium]|nr:hypothetical protein [Anaerolineae bacterium]